MNAPARLILSSGSHALESAGLHDATLVAVNMDWASSAAQMMVQLHGDVPAMLVFRGVTSLVLPKVQPWGPSNSINEGKTLAAGEYAVEMQSGDVLLVKASSWSLSVQAGLPRLP